MAHRSVGRLVLALTLAGSAAAAEPPRPRIANLLIETYAEAPEIVTPVGLTVDAKGRVFVVESHTHFRPKDYPGPPADRIRVFQGRKADGRAAGVSTFYEGSKFTMGLGFHPVTGVLYVATRYEVFILKDADGDARADGPPETVVRLETAGDYPHNGLSGVAFDAAGRVYFGLGENLGAAYKLVGKDGVTLTGGGEGGDVYRCEPDGSKLERVATGFWNPFHLAFDPYGRLFAVDNDPDSRPPCRLLHVVPGGDYGYKFRNGRRGLHPFTAWNGELPGTLPMSSGTGEAPSGLVVYGSDGLPPELNGALIATSWGDHRIEAFTPAATRPDNALSIPMTARPIVTGGEDFRPVGLAVAPDGSLFVSDWVDKSYTLHRKGRVWHVRAESAPTRVAPAGDAEALAHADRATREAAARRLGAGGEAGHAVLRAALAGQSSPLVRASALDALITAAAPADDDALRASVRDASADVRALAARRLSDRLANPRELASDASAAVRAEGLRRLTSADRLLLKAAADPDPFTRQAARQGMKRAYDTAGLLGLLRSGDPAVRLAAVLVLRDEDDAAARTAVADGLRDPDPAIKFAAVQWVAESNLDEHRAEVASLLSAPGVDQALFEGALAALERLDGEARGPKEEVAGEEYVAALLTDPKRASGLSPVVLRRALRALPPDHKALTETRVKAMLDSPDPALRVEAVRTLRDGRIPGKVETLAALAADARAPTRLRAEAVVGLASAGPGDAKALAVLRDLEKGPDPVLRAEAARSLRPAAVAAGSTKPEPLSAWLARLEGPADAEAGERLFFHPKGPGCYRCHRVDGRGGRTGPDLSATGAALTRERLVESVVDPSKEVAPQYVAWAVALTDGRVITGTFLKETLEGRVYGDSRGDLVTVKPADVDEAKPLTESIMPAGLPSAMTAQEFRDLIAYLRSPRGGAR